MSELLLPRRTFLKSAAIGAGALAFAPQLALGADTKKPSYRGPNVIIVRFGGGVRRRETIDPQHTYAPFLCHELTKRRAL